MVSKPERLAQELLARAGIAATVENVEAAGAQGSTNRIWLVRTDDERQFVLREYRWPHDSPDLDRLEKETALHDRLSARGVPVPQVLAAVPGTGSGGLLLEHVDGQLLGDLFGEVDTSDRDAAWYVTGQALRRVHQIRYPAGTTGVLVGEELRPFEQGSWGAFHVASIIHHAQRLARRGQLPVKPSEIVDTLGSAPAILDDSASCLLHNDPHPWNVLVRRGDHGWECAALLDWEYAWVGDPTWDLVRMDQFRRRDLGPTPDGFWRGYGSRPVEPHRSVYRLHINLWMLNEVLDGSDALPFTHTKARVYVNDLGHHLDRIRTELRR